jgi:NAD(P)-dependent dehydrogenase (short-subunit alcohol dehydrogenase family)
VSDPARPPPGDWTVADRTVVVTGATAGIGKETARGLVRAGARVVLVSRSQARLDATAEELRRERENAAVEVVCADLESMASVLHAGAELRRRFPAIRVLVNNAGAYFDRRALTEDGFERTFALNHLGPFLLTRALWPTLTASPPARIVTLSSVAHVLGRIELDDLQSERRFSPLGAYARSKLANVLFTTELARRLAGSGVTANCLHPGIVGSNFGDGKGVMDALFAVGRPFLRSTASGALGALRLATAPELAGVTGRYFSRFRPTQPARAGRDPVLAAKLWEATERLLARWLSKLDGESADRLGRNADRPDGVEPAAAAS